MIDARFVYLEQPAKCGLVASDFKSNYSQTLNLLETELRKLKAKEVTIQAGFRQVRNDGWPYSSAKPDHPAVALQFRTAKGVLVFRAHLYKRFEDNLRAIAKTLEALRAVDRWGVVEGQQYTGFRQLEADESVEKRARCVARVGWHSQSFVLPDSTIGSESEHILYQTTVDMDHHISTAGTLDQWREKVAELASKNSRLILSIGTAFAGPCLSLLGVESGGIHFCGSTSSGKSTALVVGASVLGGGGPNGFVQSWRATANGLEAVAELHNDLTLFLDELAQLVCFESWLGGTVSRRRRRVSSDTADFAD